jgi:serine/threonine protein kinase
LYELLTGNRPFNGKDAASVIASIIRDEPPPIATGSPLPKSLVRALRKCLAKDPDHRWQTAADLRDELQWIASGGASDTAAESKSKPWRRFAPWLAAAVFAALAAAAYLSGHRAPEDNRVVRFPLILPEDASLNFSISPDGEKVLFYRNADGAATVPWLYSLVSGEISPIQNGPKGATLWWMPDSRGLLYKAGKPVQRIDLAGGPATTVAETQSQLIGWAPGGNPDIRCRIAARAT